MRPVIECRVTETGTNEGGERGGKGTLAARLSIPGEAVNEPSEKREPKGRSRNRIRSEK